MVPVHLKALSPDKFKDGFHLNASGAQIFTDKVPALLKSRLEEHARHHAGHSRGAT
jgi:lysophospholipase L1-like esterase